MLNLNDAQAEMVRLSRLIDLGIAESIEQAKRLAETEMRYRQAKAEAWVVAPMDPPDVKAGERRHTAAAREAWVNAQTAELRRARDLAEAMRDAAREAVRARQTQLSAWQTLVRAHQAEAEFERTATRFAA